MPKLLSRLSALERTRRTDPVTMWWTLDGATYHGPNGATRTAAELPADRRHIVLSWGDEDAKQTTPG